MAGTPVLLTGLETQVLSTAGAGLWDTITGTPAIDTTVKRTGSASLRLNMADATAWFVRKTISATVVVGRFYVRRDAKPSGRSRFFQFSDGTNSIDLSFELSTATTIFLTNVATPASIGSLADTTFGRIDIKIDVTANPWTVSAYLNGVGPTTATKAVAASTLTQISLGQTGTGQTGYDCYIDDIYFTTGDAADYPLGAGYVLPYVPNRVGTPNYDAATSVFYFKSTDDGTTKTFLTTSETTSYQTIDEWPPTTGGSADLIGVRGGAGSVPTARTAGAKAASTGAGVSPALPASAANDDIEIMVATTAVGQTISITANGGGAWTLMDGMPMTGRGQVIYVWWRRHATGDSAPTVTPTGDHICAGILGYAGCVPTGSPIDVTTTGGEDASDTSLSAVTGLTSTINNCLAFAIVSSSVDSNTGQGGTAANTSLTSLAIDAEYQTNSGGGGGFVAYRGTRATAGTLGTWTDTMTSATAKNWILFALRPDWAPLTSYYTEHGFESSGELVAPRCISVIHALRNQTGTTANTITGKIRDGASDGAIYTDLNIGSATLIYKSALFATKPSGGAWTDATFDALLNRWGFTADPDSVPRLDAALIEAEFVGERPFTAFPERVVLQAMNRGGNW